MFDLYVGLLIITALAVILFWGASSLARRLPRRVSDMLACVVVAAMFFYIRYVWYDVRLTRLLPFASLIVIGNWLPLGAGLLAGLSWGRVPGQYVRKLLSVVGLFAASGYAIVTPLVGQPPSCGNAWNRDGVCLQTTNRTCTPACAATLLRLHGIAATESEMAELCLTRTGTTWLGLYRGLKRKTAGTRWDVEVLQCDADQLLALQGDPIILNVGVAKNVAAADEPRFAEWGWRPGQGHSVLLLDQRRGKYYRVADPTPGYGVEYWGESDLRLFRGTAIRLVERS